MVGRNPPSKPRQRPEIAGPQRWCDSAGASDLADGPPPFIIALAASRHRGFSHLRGRRYGGVGKDKLNSPTCVMEISACSSAKGQRDEAGEAIEQR